MSIHPRIVNGILLGNIGSFRHQLSFYLLAFFLLRLDDVFVLIVKAAAHDEEREDEGDGKESGGEYLSAITEKRHDAGLYAIAQRYSCRGKEQQTSLPCLELFALRHTGSHHIDADQQTEHGKAEMIGYHRGEHDGGKGEKECRENVGIQPA